MSFPLKGGGEHSLPLKFDVGDFFLMDIVVVAVDDVAVIAIDSSLQTLLAKLPFTSSSLSSLVLLLLLVL